MQRRNATLAVAGMVLLVLSAIVFYYEAGFGGALSLELGGTSVALAGSVRAGSGRSPRSDR